LSVGAPTAPPAPGPFSRFEFLVAGRYLRARRGALRLGDRVLTLSGIAIGVRR
jgi:lipoprotein-releasing system permease protein